MPSGTIGSFANAIRSNAIHFSRRMQNDKKTAHEETS